MSSCSVWMTLPWDKILELAFLFEVFHNMFHLKPAALTILLAVHKLLKVKRIERMIGAKYFIWVLDRKGMKLFSIFFFFCLIFILLIFSCICHPRVPPDKLVHTFTLAYILSLFLIYFSLMWWLCTMSRIPCVIFPFHHESLTTKKAEQIWKKIFFFSYYLNSICTPFSDGI